MNSAIKFVYFDVGGVLLNFEGSFAELGKRAGKPAALAREAHYVMDLEVCGGLIGVDEYWKRFQKHMGTEIEIPKRIDMFIVDYFSPIRSTHDLVHELKGQVGVGLLTNMWGEVYPLIVEKGLVPRVNYDAEVVSNQLKLHKPQPEIYEKAESLVEVDRSEILFIDDSRSNVKAATDRGWQGVVFDTKHPEESVQKLRGMLL